MAIALFLCHGGAHAQGRLHLDSLDLGAKYIKTGPVGYFNVYNVGDVGVHIYSVKVPDADTGIFKVLFVPDSQFVIKPGKFTPVGIFMALVDTFPHTTIVTIVSDAVEGVDTGLVSVLGRDVHLHTTMPSATAHAFEFFSIPVTVDHFVDQIGTSYIQRYSCELTYNPEVLTLDTAALTVGRDTQGVSSGFTFKIDSPYTPGRVNIHASGPTGGIHMFGDTIFKLAFQANQFLFSEVTTLTTTFRGDSGFLYANFESDAATFTTLPCFYPSKVVQSVSAHLLGNHPNPFNPSTRVRFKMDAMGYVQIRLYDRLGRAVRTLVDGLVDRGEHEIMLQCDDLPSGPYFCRLSTPICSDERMITLSR